MASVPVHTPAERLSEGLSPRQDGCNQMFLVWEAIPTSSSYSFRHVPCRLHSSGFLHNARGNDSSTTSVAQEEMHSGLPDVMPVRVTGKLACMLMWATGGSLQAIALINRIPAKDQRLFCIRLTSFWVPQETDEGGGPSVSEEEMKRRKNKAVMSWLVSFQTLLTFLRCTTCLHSSCRQPGRQSSLLYQHCTIPENRWCPYVSAS